KTAANHSLAMASPVVGKTRSWRKILARISECLLLVTQPQVQRQVVAHMEIVLGKKRPNRIVHRIAAVALALGVVPEFVDFVKNRRALPQGERLLTRFVRKLAEKNRAAKFLAVSSIVRVDHVPADANLMMPQ